MKNLIIREIENEDYNKGYMDIMYEFTNYKHDLTHDDFINYLNKNQHLIRILVIFSPETDKIVGAGTIFKIDKLHNNPVGQIEDVIINNEYRGHGLGKILINKLVNIGLNDFKCYKIILNCLEKNTVFYKKCGFEFVGVEMKFIL
jgi:glucosamine-phosphate N-acetyltransferase